MSQNTQLPVNKIGLEVAGLGFARLFKVPGQVSSIRKTKPKTSRELFSYKSAGQPG